jgi:amino acid transporter
MTSNSDPLADYTSSATATVTRDADTQRLHELGYAQELHRGLGWFTNFAVSFTIISILTGGITTYYLAMDAGGPRAATVGWLFVGGMSLIVGLAMAEVCSAYPTAGGLYYWAAKVAKPGRAAIWSWYTGWFNLVGHVAVTASIDFGLATIIGFFIRLTVNENFAGKPWQILVIYVLVLIAHGLINSFGVGLVARLNDISVWWHVVGTVVLVVMLFALPAHTTSLSHVFSDTSNLTGFTGTDLGTTIWVTFVGLMLTQYTITGFDASAHMTEETQDAARSGPKGIVTSIWVSVVVGFILMIGLSVAVPFAVGTDEYAALAGNGILAGPTIIVNAIGGNLAKFVLFAIIVAQFFCGMASVTANSRMIYAFSRDGAIPGSQLWHRINPRTRTPTNSIWFAVVGATILGLPSLYTRNNYPVAFFAIVSVAVVGLYVSYVIPVFLRRRNAANFVKGPWSLGKWSPLVGWLAVVWVIAILFPLMGPQFYPYVNGKFEPNAFNFAPLVLVLVIGFAAIYWAVSARKWFKGPKVQGSADELAAIERDLTLSS